MKIYAACCCVLVIAVVLFQFTGAEKKPIQPSKPLRPASFPTHSESDALAKAHNEFGNGLQVNACLRGLQARHEDCRQSSNV